MRLQACSRAAVCASVMPPGAATHALAPSPPLYTTRGTPSSAASTSKALLLVPASPPPAPPPPPPPPLPPPLISPSLSLSLPLSLLPLVGEPCTRRRVCGGGTPCRVGAAVAAASCSTVVVYASKPRARGVVGLGSGGGDRAPASRRAAPQLRHAAHRRASRRSSARATSGSSAASGRGVQAARTLASHGANAPCAGGGGSDTAAAAAAAAAGVQSVGSAVRTR